MNKSNLGNVVNIGLPIFLLIIACFSFIWFFIEVKKKRIQLKSMFIWLLLNVCYTLIIIYISIVEILRTLNYDAFNVLNWISDNWFGIVLPNNKEWIFFLWFIFVSYLLIKTLSNSIKISKLEERISRLSSSVAILSGKINKTIDLDTSEFVVAKTLKETKKDFKEQIKIVKLEAETKKKINEILKKQKEENKK